MRLSVAFNHDKALPEVLQPFPVKEIYGGINSRFFGEGRESFPPAHLRRSHLEKFIKKIHKMGIEFSYMLDSSSTGNIEYTRKGQRKTESMLDWLNGIDVDSVTVASIYLLRLIKRRYPRFRVRISSHRFTASPRQVRFWIENGADSIIINEAGIYREFRALEAIRKAAEDVPLFLIVNNWCRVDCAIAGNHASALSASSRNKNTEFPLDYCYLVCNDIRIKNPVNYLRANWIRPEDLNLYEAMGYEDFIIGGENTPTAVLTDRVKAYTEKRFNGNLMYLIQNHAYPSEKYNGKIKNFFSYGRYFFKPSAVNLFKLNRLRKFGEASGLFYPLHGENPVYVDNRALDGFMDRFKTGGCRDTDCVSCGYCGRWADKAVRIAPEWKEMINRIYDELLDEINYGSFWETFFQSAIKKTGRALDVFPGKYS